MTRWGRVGLGWGCVCCLGQAHVLPSLPQGSTQTLSSPLCVGRVLLCSHPSEASLLLVSSGQVLWGERVCFEESGPFSKSTSAKSWAGFPTWTLFLCLLERGLEAL